MASTIMILAGYDPRLAPKVCEEMAKLYDFDIDYITVDHLIMCLTVSIGERKNQSVGST